MYKSLKKTLFLFLILIALGVQSKAQSTQLLLIPSLSSDTVLVMDKKAAALQATFNNHSFQLRERYWAAIEREEKYFDLYLKEIEIGINLKAQLKILAEQGELKDEERERLMELCKKQKRKNFVIGALSGVAVFSAAVLILN